MYKYIYVCVCLYIYINSERKASIDGKKTAPSRSMTYEAITFSHHPEASSSKRLFFPSSRSFTLVNNLRGRLFLTASHLKVTLWDGDVHIQSTEKKEK